MPELPEYMLAKGRRADQNFSPHEFLYRRVPDALWGDDETGEDVHLDAVEFPDMSVTRAKYGPASAARWFGDHYLDWGVIGFQVADLPRRIPFAGAFVYRMRPRHVPLKNNYPHSEVWVHERPWLVLLGPGRHIDKAAISEIDLAARQEWRERLRRRCRIMLHPGRCD